MAAIAWTVAAVFLFDETFLRKAGAALFVQV